MGVGGAVLASVLAGAVLFATGAGLEGTTEAAFEAGTMLAAAAVLAWMIVWMGRRAKALRGELSGQVAAAAGSAAALFWLGFILVVREGLETGLFLFAAVGEERSLGALAGGLAGIAVAGGLGYAVYRGGSRLNVRAFFTVLNVVLLGFGAYLVLRGVGELAELAAGGEAGELAGPVAAGLYAGLMIWVLLRERRGTQSGGEAVCPPPTGVAGRAPAGSSCRR
jgi:high-affinity iron transporter